MSIKHILGFIGWLWSDAMNNGTAFAKAPNEYHRCGNDLVQYAYIYWKIKCIKARQTQSKVTFFTGHHFISGVFGTWFVLPVDVLIYFSNMMSFWGFENKLWMNCYYANQLGNFASLACSHDAMSLRNWCRIESIDIESCSWTTATWIDKSLWAVVGSVCVIIPCGSAIVLCVCQMK